MYDSPAVGGSGHVRSGKLREYESERAGDNRCGHVGCSLCHNIRVYPERWCRDSRRPTGSLPSSRISSLIIEGRLAVTNVVPGSRSGQRIYAKLADTNKQYCAHVVEQFLGESGGLGSVVDFGAGSGKPLGLVARYFPQAGSWTSNSMRAISPICGLLGMSFLIRR